MVSGLRPNWGEWAMGIAKAVSLRGDCTRRQVGCVILGPNHEPISFGYNGAPSGAPGCLTDGACPRGRHYPDPEDSWYCACGLYAEEEPCPKAVPEGSSYDTGPGACISIHAEANALLWAGQGRLKGATLYVTEKPCDGCWRLIRATRIERVVWPTGEGVND